MKKLIRLLLILTCCLCFTACGDLSQDSEEPLEQEEPEAQEEEIEKDEEDTSIMLNENVDIEIHPLYKAYISEIETTMKNGLEDEDLDRLQLSSIFSYFRNYPVEGKVNDTLGYCCWDVDGDGSFELLIGENTVMKAETTIYGIYTMEEDKVVRKVNGWERNRFYLCENGMIANQGSGGAADSVFGFYNYRTGELIFHEAVIYDGMEDEENPWFYSAIGTNSEVGASITEEEARGVIDSYKLCGLELTLFEFHDN